MKHPESIVDPCRSTQFFYLCDVKFSIKRDADQRRWRFRCLARGGRPKAIAMSGGFKDSFTKEDTKEDVLGDSALS